MNERIRQLAEQVVGPSRLHGGDFALMGNEQVEKFGELIVKECVSIMTDASDSKLRLSDAIWNTKIHFGVE